MTSLDLWREALTVLATVAGPFLMVALVLGLAVALLQTATQLQESVLSFVPKLIGALLVLALGGHYMLDRLGQFSTEAIATAARTTGERP